MAESRSTKEKILQQYSPSQALKELVLNADTANATNIKFLLDKRSHKQNNSLLNIVTKFFPESNQTPAPALIVLNDAMFTESDWKKLTEPPLNLDDTVSLKFGTGFFATYRFSDYPIVISPDCCGIINARKFIKHDAKCGCQKFDFSTVDLTTLQLPPGFIPDDKVFTMFYFPLKVSEEYELGLEEADYSRARYYDDDEDYYDNFYKKRTKLGIDSHEMLLLFQSITKIEAYEILDTGVQHIFSCSKSVAFECLSNELEKYQFQDSLVSLSKFIGNSNNKTQKEFLVSQHCDMVDYADTKNMHASLKMAIPIPTEARKPSYLFYRINYPLVYISGTFEVNRSRKLSLSTSQSQVSEWNKLIMLPILGVCYAHVINELQSVCPSSYANKFQNFPENCKCQHFFYDHNLDLSEAFLNDTVRDVYISKIHRQFSTKKPAEDVCSMGLEPPTPTDDSEFIGDAGQYEPLTTRLGNILREYKAGGLTIIKELIQNAEDAGATEVNILFDHRTHSLENLKFPGMDKAHGPALVVHNNAKFTDKDFENITKLAGATKKDMAFKIGKFGIGFCSVYHLTDVPSFVSGEWLYIFDPTFEHLEKEIKDKNQPGKKIKYTHPEAFESDSQKRQQLAPYESLFKFNYRTQYNGTIFRFPFRKVGSGISQKSYSNFFMHFTMYNLKNDLLNEGAKTILFLQKIRTIKFLSINRSTPKKPNVEITITSEDIRQHYYGRAVHHKLIKSRHIHFLGESNVTVADCLPSYEENHVLVSSEHDRSSDKIASVAVYLKPIDSQSTTTFECVSVQGEIFCFLPIGVGTGLDVHVNANFVVQSNRSGIDERDPRNKDLMVTIADAYMNLLHALKEMQRQKKLDSYTFDRFLPLRESLINRKIWEPMVIYLYENLFSKYLLYSANKKDWISPRNSKFIIGLLALSSRDADTPQCIRVAASILPTYSIVDVSTSLYNHIALCFKSKKSEKSSKLKNKEFIEGFLMHSDVFADGCSSLYIEVLNHIFFYGVIVYHGSNLFKNWGISDAFSIESLLKTFKLLYKIIQSEDRHEQVQPALIQGISTILNRLTTKLTTENKSFSLNFSADCYILPDHQYVLKPVDKLVVREAGCSDIPLHEDYSEVSRLIDQKLAVALGVNKLDRSTFLEKYISEIEIEDYGQSEELTQRIKNILHDYPLDETFLYELLQNADDAKASKFCIILDKRKHGVKNIFSPSWSDLQGPAVLLWNNGTFTDEDMKGLQKLGLGSKRDDTDTIGQFGIGFNVVYHVTDCPSFIVDGTTMCILDPHCRFSNDESSRYKKRGKRLNNLTADFWKHMSDVADAYLFNDNLQRKHSFNPLKGTLFRLPLRSLSQTAAISDSTVEFAEPITCNQIEKNLSKWVPLIREAMIFMQNIRVFQYLVIDEGGTTLKASYEVTSLQSADDIVQEYSEAIDQFKKSETPYLKMFELVIKAKELKKEFEEKWLIQHGVGHPNRNFEKKECVKFGTPKHGIAVKLNDAAKSEMAYKGKLFCSLPLPIYSNLPVHINGNFVLGTNRRSLWTGGDKRDKRSKWNSFILDALALSYSVFLENAFDVILKKEYDDKPGSEANYLDDTKKYYHLFPSFLNHVGDSKPTTHDHDELFTKFAESVFRYLWVRRSSKVLACKSLAVPQVDSQSATICVKKHRLKSSKIFFGPLPKEKSYVPIFEKIGMKLTDAPISLYNHFNAFDDFDQKLLFAQIDEVFDYFCRRYAKIFFESKLPCKVTSSPFQSATEFRKFVFYLMDLDKKSGLYMFPEDPFGYPLLMTADGMIRKFDKDKKVFQSLYSHVFPKSLEYFLHRELIVEGTPLMHFSYFLASDEIKLSFVENLFETNFSSFKTDVDQEMNEKTCLQQLNDIWKCLSKDKDNFTKTSVDHIVAHWKFLPAKSGALYTSTSLVRPLVPLNKSHKDYKIYECLTRYGLPELMENFSSFPIIKEYCLDVSKDCDLILKALYEVYVSEHLKQENLFDKLKNNEYNDLVLIADYLGRVSYRGDASSCLNTLKSLPIFETIFNQLTSLNENKKVYLWPDNMCTAGRRKWLSADDKCVFLSPNGLWKKMCDSELLISQSITAREVFTTFVLPNIHKLDNDEIIDQLRFARDSLLPYALIEARKKKSRSDVSAITFINELRSTQCIAYQSDFHYISEFCLHTSEIFKIIPDIFMFLPLNFFDASNQLECDDWLEFYLDLGLKTEVTEDEFIFLCENVSCSELDANDTASILLKYLLSDKTSNWSRKKFLEIAKIKFIPRLAVNDIEIVKKDSATFTLVSLGESAVVQCRPLVWAIKPVIALPDTENGQIKQEVLKSSNITVIPTASDVYKNVCEIASRKQLSSFDLFDKYSIEISENWDMIINSIRECFLFLQKEKATESLEKLCQRPCLPVPAVFNSSSGKGKKENKFVLVRPIDIVRKMTEQEKKDFFPYIHVLPGYLKEIEFILSNIGVEEKLTVQHMEMILATIYSHSADKSKLDPNQVNVIHNVLVKLGKMFFVDRYVHNECNDDDMQQNSSELYLPIKKPGKWKLHKSDEVVLVDQTRYSKLDFTNQDCFPVFKLPHGSSSEHHDSKKTVITELDICLGLSESRRPQILSRISYCHEVLINENEEDQEVKGYLNPLFLHLNSLKKRKYFHKFQLLIPSIIQESDCKAKAEIVERFASSASQILQSMSIRVLERLNIGLISSTNNRQILTFQPNIHLQHKSNHFKLYISKFATARPPILLEVAEVVCLEAMNCDKSLINLHLDDVVQFKLAIQECLKVSSHQEMKFLCEKYNVSIGNEGAEKKKHDVSHDAPNDDEVLGHIEPDLGACIPEVVSDIYLDRSDSNSYRPQEWVGYEIGEEIFIWAVVLYPNDDESYTIMINKKDRETITEIAPTSKLSKFVMIDYDEEDDDQPKVESRQSPLQEKKDEIFKTLRNEILDDIKERVIRRIYLKYHPDSVRRSSKKQLYKELHMYLLTQLTRIENGEEVNMDTLELDEYIASSRWLELFSQWNVHVNRIQQNRLRVKSRYGERRMCQSSGPDSSRSTGPHYVDMPPSDSTLKGKKLSFQPDPSDDEAKRWLKQANADFKEMNRTSSPCHKLFLAHEVIEKSLKAGVYKFVGLNPSFLKHHDIKTHAHALNCLLKPPRDVALVDIATKVEEKEYYVKSRFPNQIDGVKAPVDVFTSEEADEISKNATNVFSFIQKMV